MNIEIEKPGDYCFSFTHKNKIKFAVLFFLNGHMVLKHWVTPVVDFETHKINLTLGKGELSIRTTEMVDLYQCGLHLIRLTVDPVE